MVDSVILKLCFRLLGLFSSSLYYYFSVSHFIFFFASTGTDNLEDKEDESQEAE